MAEKHDILDDIIELQQNWQAVKNPLGNVAEQLMADPDKTPRYNPSDFKVRPRANSVSCLRIASGIDKTCTRCLDVCPVDAISFEGSSVLISEACRKCGLCIAACPTEAFVAQAQMAKQLYDRIARIASAYNQCYITCTRALGRLPKDNEVLLPCVGLVPRELWFALLADYSNISVYLPLGICDKCRTTTGEEFFSEEIATGEEQSIYHVGLEVEESALDHEQTRDYKRKQFLSSMAQAGTQILSRGVPVLAGAQAVAERIKKHSSQINSLQSSLEKVVGAKNAQSRRRLLTQKRKMELATLQTHPHLAQDRSWLVPLCDIRKCTMCGECLRACPQHACQLDEKGHFSVEAPYCVNCGACVVACPEDALSLTEANPADMIVPDPQAERLQKQKEQIEAAKKKGAKALKQGSFALSTFAEELSKEYKSDKKPKA